MQPTSCHICSEAIITAQQQGFTEEFHLSQNGQIVLPVIHRSPELEIQSVAIAESCIECLRTIYMVITEDGTKGIIIDHWENITHQ